MIALLTFLHVCYIRSYRFAPPLLVFLFGVTFIYSVVPNPVMESYVFSLSFLFVIACAVGYAVIDLEESNQEAVTVLHVGRLHRVALGKLLYSWLFTGPLTLFAVFYPALFNKFNRCPELEELVMSMLYHSAAALLGVSLACWFSKRWMTSRANSFLLFSLLILTSFCTGPLRDVLPEVLRPIVWIVPPVDRMISVLYQFETVTYADKLLALGVPLLYAIISCTAFIVLLHKRRSG